jgi:hypothetical protein
MSNKRITDLTELTTPTTDDVFPVVDIATNTTTKVQLANLPVQTAVTTALATKQATLVSGTNIKTVNSTTLLGSGDIAVQPTLVSGTSIKTVNSNSLLGAGDVAVQETLVSGTNIKTLNSVSLLGAGNIVLAATPSGVAGAIQFSNGSAFASDATNLFWDDTNKRLGVGTNSPSATAHFKGSGTTSSTTSLLVQNSAGTAALTITDDRNATFGSAVSTGGNIISGANVQAVSTGYFILQNRLLISSPSVGILKLGNNNDNDFSRLQFGGTTSSFPSIKRNGTAIDFRLADDSAFAPINAGATTLRGSGSTSATTSLLVQNSGGNTAFQVRDDRTVSTSGGDVSLRDGSFYVANNFITSYGQSIGFYGATVASAIVEIQSTTKGFLPPRMTTTQKNAIASPATGLMVMDITTLKLCVYNGSSWVDLH